MLAALPQCPHIVVAAAVWQIDTGPVLSAMDVTSTEVTKTSDDIII